MNHKVGKYYFNHNSLLKFAFHICNELNIYKPNVYIINTPYPFEFISKFYMYQYKYLKTPKKEIYNPPKLDLFYYNENFELEKYVSKSDCNFLGIYHIEKENIYINLGYIYSTVALRCLQAKKNNKSHFFLTERKLTNEIKRTIMHECYHHYQKINNLKLDCDKCDDYACKKLKEVYDYKLTADKKEILLWT